MAFYESIVIIRQDVSSTDVDKIIDELKKVIEDYKGRVVKTEYWGLRSLAYEIQNNKRGQYYFMGIEANSQLLQELNRRIQLSESIIRSSLVKVKEISSEVSPILKEDRDSSEDTVNVTIRSKN